MESNRQRNSTYSNKRQGLRQLSYHTEVGTVAGTLVGIVVGTRAYSSTVAHIGNIFHMCILDSTDKNRCSMFVEHIGNTAYNSTGEHSDSIAFDNIVERNGSISYMYT